MVWRSIARAVLLVGVVLLAACGEPSTADILKKAEGITTKSELESKLGKPSEVNKVGPLETWTYKASNGQVSFLITGDRVQLSAASGAR